MVKSSSAKNSTGNVKHVGAGHRKRLRERFLQSGLDGFLDYEIVELLLTLGTPRKDCKQVAKAAIKKFGGLRGVLEATPADLRQIKGIGSSNYFGLKLFQDIEERLAKEKIPVRITLNSSRSVAKYLQKSIGKERKEHFVALYLNSKNHLLSEETISIGTVDANLVHPREVFNPAVRLLSTQVIIAHNHPSNDLLPSPEDVAITRRLQEAAKIFGIELLDHIIVGKDNHSSLREQNLM